MVMDNTCSEKKENHNLLDLGCHQVGDISRISICRGTCVVRSSCKSLIDDFRRMESIEKRVCTPIGAGRGVRHAQPGLTCRAARGS